MRRITNFKLRMKNALPHFMRLIGVILVNAGILNNSFSSKFMSLMRKRGMNRSITTRFVVMPFMALILGGFMVYFFLLKGDGAAAWFNDAWGYRVRVPVTNNTTQESNVYIQITGYSTADTSKFQTDCGDIRFTDTNGVELEYYIASGCGTGSTTIQVEIPTFKPGLNNIFLYFGNAAAVNGFQGSGFSTVATNYTVGTLSYQETWTKGPITYWSLNEGYGTDVNDSTGNAYDGVLGSGSSAPSWRTSDFCYIGSCLQFDGSNDYVDIGAAATEVRSLSFWIKSTDASDQILDLNGSAYVTLSSGSVTATGFTSPTIYVNGVVSSTVAANRWSNVVITTATGINASDMDLGRIEGVGYFQGFIDEVKLYDFVLSAQQVKLNYNSPGSAKGAAIVFGAQDQAFLSDGLVGYWDMEGIGVTGNGVSIPDKSGNGNNGTTVIGTNTTGMNCTLGAKYGNSCNFDGTDDYVAVGDLDTFDFEENDSFAVSAWVKTNSSNANHRIIVSNQSNISTVAGFSLFKRTSNGLAGIRIADGDSSAEVLSSITWNNEWSHLVGVVDRNLEMITLYINGEPVGTTTISENVNSIGTNTPLTIGARNSGSYNWEGDIDEVRIYNRALSADEVKKLYTWAPGPVAYYDFEEGSGVTVNDKSGNGYDGSLTGSPERVTGKFGKGIQLNGTSQFVNIGVGTSLVNTISFWVYPQTTTEYFINIASTTDYISATAGTISATGFTSPSIYVNGSESTQLTAGTWQFITVTSSTSENASTFEIGRTGGSNYLEGLIDDVRIYNYARTQEQILEDMNAGHPAIGTPVGSAVTKYSFDEGYGDTAHDTSPQGNNGDLAGDAVTCPTAGNCPDWTQDGKFGKALSFAGDDYLEASDPLTSGSDHTISAWIYRTGSPDGSNGGGIVGSWQTNQGYMLWLAPDNTLAYPINASSHLNSGVTTTINTWYHVVGTYDGSTARIYVDGVLQNSQADTFTSSGAALQIGAYAQASSTTFPGIIDEVAIYQFAASDEQVALIFNQSKQLILGSTGTTSSGMSDNSAGREYCVPGDSSSCSAPVLEMNFEENSGATVYDTSTNGRTGALIGGTAWGIGRNGAGAGLRFDGTDDYVDIGVGPTSVNTLSFWVNPATTTQPLINITGTTDYISVSSGTVTATGFSSPTIYVNGRVSGQVVANQWNHIAITTATAENASNFDIGRTQNANYFQGLIDEVRMYSYVRSRAQVAWDHNKGAPVAWYKFDECQGSTAYDATGRGNNGTITIGASGSEDTVGNCTTASTAWGTAATAKRNSGLSFDGTDDRVVMTGSSSSLAMQSAVTLVAWIYPRDNNYGLIVGKPQAASHTSPWYDYGLVRRGASPQDIEFWVEGSVARLEVGSTPLNTWTHIVAVWDQGINNGDAVIYVNGREGGYSDLDNKTNNIVDGGQDVRIGVAIDGTSDSFDGMLDDVRIYNYALTAEQARQIYRGGAVNFE